MPRLVQIIRFFVLFLLQNKYDDTFLKKKVGWQPEDNLLFVYARVVDLFYFRCG